MNEPHFTIDDGQEYVVDVHRPDKNYYRRKSEMPEKTDPGKMKPEELERMRKAGYEVKPSDGKNFMPNQPKSGEGK